MISYVIQRMETAPYFNQGQMINGYALYVYFPEFDETHKIYAPDNKPDTVKRTLDAWIVNRKAIASLGAE